MGLDRTIKATRIYNGTDQKSHFEEFEITLNDEGKIGFLSERKKLAERRLLMTRKEKVIKPTNQMSKVNKYSNS